MTRLIGWVGMLAIAGLFWWFAAAPMWGGVVWFFQLLRSFT